MVSPLVLEEHLNDDFYFDLPMEDLEGNQLTEEDWDASLQHLELPSDDLIGGLSTPFTVKIFDDNSLSRTSSSKVSKSLYYQTLQYLFNNFVLLIGSTWRGLSCNNRFVFQFCDTGSLNKN